MLLWFIPCNLLVQSNLLHISTQKVHRYYILNTTIFSFYSIRLITPCSISWIPFVYLLEHPSTSASGILPTEQQYNGHFVNTLFISSTHHCLSLLIAFNTLFLSRLLFVLFCCGCNTPVMRVYKHSRLIVWVLSVSRT